MYLRIQNVLTAEQLETIDGIVGRATFADGAASAGPLAKRAKHNLQLDRDASPDVDTLDNIVLQALAKHPLVRAAALPRRIRPPLYNRYGPGMEYGVHVDNPLLQERPPMRTDVSVTVFLTEPEDYDGGELVLTTEAGELKLKLAKGDAVIYPTGALHRVAEVTKGERTAAVTWIQSMVADPNHRRILFDLDRACQAASAAQPEADWLPLLTKTYGELLRLWAEV